LAPFPSTASLLDDDSLLEAELLAELLELSEPLELSSSELEPQAVRDIAAATPSTASDTVVLRMRCSPFRGGAGLSQLRHPRTP
jgi:hypothetical protein